MNNNHCAPLLLGTATVYSVVISANVTDLLNDQGWVTTPIMGSGALGDYVDNRRFFILVSTFGVLIPLCLLPNFNRCPARRHRPHPVGRLIPPCNVSAVAPLCFSADVCGYQCVTRAR